GRLGSLPCRGDEACAQVRHRRADRAGAHGRAGGRTDARRLSHPPHRRLLRGHRPVRLPALPRASFHPRRTQRPPAARPLRLDRARLSDLHGHPSAVLAGARGPAPVARPARALLLRGLLGARALAAPRV
ncbi:MAG: hypothetical protein AVDCRST_MAG45-1127, partial [uncultured Solirubrobacterales bacterium]